MEYVPNSVDLKTYILKHYPAPTPTLARAQCFELGQALGSWLRIFHKEVMQNEELLEIVKQYDFAPMIKHMINFNWLAERVKTYPDILEEAKETFEQLEKYAATEEKSQINHGDFWTGKYVDHWNFRYDICFDDALAS